MKILRSSRFITGAVALLFAVSGTIGPSAQACPVRAYTEAWWTRVGPSIVVGECYHGCDGSVSCWGDNTDEYRNKVITYHEFCGPCDPE